MNRAWRSSMAMFLVHGLVFATWVSRIPAVQVRLALNNATLGLTLLGTACGSILAIPWSGALVARHGSRRVTRWTTLGFCFALIPVSLAVNAVSLAAALVVLGAFGGAMDVAMNVQGVEVEKALGRPAMSRFHAMFSIGGMAGAALGGVIASRGIDPRIHFTGAAILFSLLAAPFFPGMIEGAPAVHDAGFHLPFRRVPRALVAVAAIAFCMLLSEGAMADWTGVYLRQTLGAGPGTAAAGYAVFSAAMALFRLLGDAITEKLGGSRTVRIASLVGAAGILLAIMAPSIAWAMPGFAAAGAGFSVIVPLAFGSGGRVEGVSPGPGVAAVTGVGYIGLLVGPPLIGFTAQALSLRFALGMIAALSLATAWLAGWIRK